MSACHLAIVGATGMLGQEILRVLEERAFPVGKITLLASSNSEGSHLTFGGKNVVVRLLSKESLSGVDVAIFAAAPQVSKDYSRFAAQAGTVVIDASSAFRLDPDVPLCVPELNASVIPQGPGLVAMPHSLTTQIALVLSPLHAAASLKRVVLTTYQSVSGLGHGAVHEFDQQLRSLLNFHQPEVQNFPHQMAFNCLPQCGAFLDNGYTEDEMALIDETRRLLSAPSLPITATSALVPLPHGHCASITVETERQLSPDAARLVLEEAQGVVVEDDQKRRAYPFPTLANGQDEVFVGRIRRDHSVSSGLQLWTAADNLRQGGALSAVQIAEHIVLNNNEHD
ncbi:MAG: aspartate-semialdehyde dehydrogenase [bacterium]|nr:aspartate-semialdehyde dehydrogenase [bacterium]